MVSKEGLQAWLDVRHGRRELASLSQELRTQYFEIEIWNQVEDDRKNAQVAKAFPTLHSQSEHNRLGTGINNSDYPQRPGDRELPSPRRTV